MTPLTAADEVEQTIVDALDNLPLTRVFDHITSRYTEEEITEARNKSKEKLLITLECVPMPGSKHFLAWAHQQYLNSLPQF